MSYTEIYVLGENPYHAGETQNAWRGAMYVWNQIAIDYFGLQSFPTFDEDMQWKIWNAQKHHEIKDFERVVLASTMDNAVLKGSDAKALVEHFRKYAEAHPNSSIGEQADIIESLNASDDQFIAWCQTTVSGFWGREFNEETEEYDYYDVTSGSKHFFVEV